MRIPLFFSVQALFVFFHNFLGFFFSGADYFVFVDGFTWDVSDDVDDA
jgi:hypothetical protein